MAATSGEEARKFDTLSVRELRVYLRDRGVPVSGTRPELIKRAEGACKLQFRPLKENLAVDVQRNAARFTTPLGEKLPRPEELSNWETGVERIPLVRSSDLYNYLVLNRNRTFDSQSIKAKRQLKAKVFYEDRHVHSVLYHEINSECSHCYVSAKVIPSLPTGTEKQKPDYYVWVCLSKVSGQVHSAGCACSAGEGEACNHIAALLYAAVDIGEKKREGLHAPTSSKCAWNQPRKRRLSPKRSQNLVFKKHKFTTENSTDININVTATSKKRLENLDTIKPVDTEEFTNKLKLCAPHAAFLLSDTNNTCKSVQERTSVRLPPLHNIGFMYNDGVDLKSEKCVSHFSDYFDKLKCSESECHIIAEETIGQSKNKLWVDAKSGRLTSSNFGRICKLKETTAPDNTVKTVLNYSQFKSKATEWGKQHESAARRVYSRTIQKSHPNMKVFRCGICIDPDYPHLGSSPDALLTCPHCDQHEGVLEIKCPYKSRMLTPTDAAEDKSFFCEIVDGQLRLKRNHDYYYQVQGQMAITKRMWCDFFIWTLKGYSVERIYFDRSFWTDMVRKLNAFYEKCVIPELWSERIKRNRPLFPK